MKYESLSSAGLVTARDELVDLLQVCVHDGASLGFLAPLAESEAVEYWSGVEAQVAAGTVWVVVGRERPAGRVVGSGQLRFETRSNGRHRAEVSKLMVLPSHRGRGIATSLMGAMERHARARDVRLLVLDTSEGRGGARQFYERLGYVYAGGIPDFALDPDGTPAANAIFYKALTSRRNDP